MCDSETVTITINPVNDYPVAIGEDLVTDEDTPISGDLNDNISDVDGDNLSITLVGNSLPNPETEGTVVLNPDGTYTFTPVPGFFGIVTFEYEVCDDGTPVRCARAVVSITVEEDNEAPVAMDDEAATDPGTSVTINVLNNDTDPDGDELTITQIVDQPENGLVVINSDGTVTYTPDTNFTGIDTFTYQVCDDSSPQACTTAMVTVTADGQELNTVDIDEEFENSRDSDV